MTFIDGQSDPSKQSASFEDAIVSDQYDAFFLQPIDGISLVPIVERAIEEGLAGC